MVFASTKQSNRRGRLPDETTQLTESLSLSIWKANGERGPRFHWDVARVGDNGQTFKTKRPEDLLELLPFTATLSEMFANSSTIDNGLRKQFAAMSVALGEVIEVLNSSDANGEAKSNAGAASIFG